MAVDRNLLGGESFDEVSGGDVLSDRLITGLLGALIRERSRGTPGSMDRETRDRVSLSRVAKVRGNAGEPGEETAEVTSIGKARE